MDIDKLLATASTYAGEYINAFVSTFRDTKLYFAPRSAITSGILPESELKEKLINPRLVTFAILSIAAGSSLFSIAARAQPLGWAQRILLPFALWVLLGCIGYWLCKKLGGRADFIDSCSVAIQIFAVTYVISSLAGLIVRIVMSATGYLRGPSDIDSGNLAYLPVQFVLLAIYLPRGLGYVHGLSKRRMIVLALLLPLVVLGLNLCLMLVGMLILIQMPLGG